MMANLSKGHAMKKQGTLLDGKDICVVDDCFSKSEIRKIYDLLSGQVFIRRQKDTLTDPYPILSCHFEPETAHQFFFYQKIKNTVTACFPKERFEPARSYVNQSYYGDMSYPHSDFLPGSGNITVLYFANPKWKEEWGGGTLMLGEKSAFNVEIQPKPGRLVLFRGELKHAGGTPSRVCPIPRYVLVLKMVHPKKRGPGK